MRLFWRREAKSAVPLTAISGLRAAQWSGARQLAREGVERNPVPYRCLRLISVASASVGVAAEGDDDAMARLLSRPNIEEHGADLAAVFAPARKAA